MLGMGLALNKNTFINPYILNQIRNAYSAYALRKLKSTATRSIRVRRSSDSAEQDIPFCGYDLCLSTLTSFVGSDSAFVTTWYDQIGTKNLTQSNAALQPRIVNAGIIERMYDATKANALYPTFASASGVNLVSNGDFSDGTSGWSAGTGSTISAASNILTATGLGGSTTVAAFNNTSTPLVVGKRYFIRAKLKVTNNSCTNIYIRINGSVSGSSTSVSSQATPTQNNVYTLSGIYVHDGTRAGNVQVIVRHDYVDDITANGKVMEVQEVVAIDVTDMGMPAIYSHLSTTLLQASTASDWNFLHRANGVCVNTVANFDLVATGLIKSFLSTRTATTGFTMRPRNIAGDTTIFNVFASDNTVSTINSSTATGTVAQGQDVILTAEHATSRTNDIGLYNKGSSVVNVNYLATATNSYTCDIPLKLGGDATFKVSELILFDSITPQRSKLEKNQGKYYSITVA